jgi:radical SAM protein
MPAAAPSIAARTVTPPRPEFAHSPLIVFYELTRACDLVCQHCRASAQKQADPCELTPSQSLAMIDDLARFPSPPMLVLTGGDPFKRRDLFTIIERSVSHGMETAITPSATPLMTTRAVEKLKAAGIGRMAISLDGVDAPTHDALRGVPGTFDHALRIIRTAREVGIPIQINTTITPQNYDQLEAMAALLETLDIVLWSVFFIIPVGRATESLRLSGEQHEAAFARLWQLAQTMPFGIKTTEAMHYRRYVLQQAKAARAAGHGEPGPPTKGPRSRFFGVNDGKGILFVSHKGEVQPSGFFPVICGQFPAQSVVDLYQNHPLFLQLRDASQLEGKCRLCEYRNLCGGSRARAFAVTGNPMAAEPDCVYIPPAYARQEAEKASVAG